MISLCLTRMVMGFSGAIIAIGWGVTGVLSGELLRWSYTLALYIAVCVAIIGCIILKKVRVSA